MFRTKRRISVKAVFALLFYLVIPAIAIYIIMGTYPELSKERFINMTYWFVPLSIVLVIISQFSIRYKKGDDRRFILNVGYVIVTMLWLYGFLGGSLVITETWGEYQFSVHLWRYVILIIFVAIFNIFYYTLEWRIYKREIKDLKKNKVIGISSKPKDPVIYA
jgi:hypothetical protein